MSALIHLFSTWLRLFVLTVSCCAAPSILLAQTVAPKTDDCIVSWNPVTTDIYNLPTSISGYKIYVARSDAATLPWGLPIDVPPSPTPQITCKALGMNQQGIYGLSVTSYNSAFESAFSEIVKVSLTISPLSLEVAGAPNLPFHGTTTLVTVWIAGETPTTVELSRDGYPPFTTWPSDTFFTLSPDGRSLTGNWCLTSSCWSEVQGPHILNVVATYATGATATAAVTLNVAD